jgi:nitrogen fixation/metabolism regulation signal transduction histidine kinase
MTVNTALSRTSTRPRGGPPKRKLRNYLLDPRFQLKYVSMVVGVTVLVAGVLGYVAYDYSKAQTQMMTMMQMERRAELDATFVKYLEREAEKADRTVLIGILTGILCLAVALGLTGIIVTHKLVGPAYKIRLLLAEVRDGHLNVEGSLRKGDELRDVFVSFEEMVQSLRTAQTKEVEQLEAALARARTSGVSSEALQEIVEVIERMKKTLQ